MVEQATPADSDLGWYNWARSALAKETVEVQTNVMGRRILGFAIDWILAAAAFIVIGTIVLESFEGAGATVGSDACDLVEDEYPLCFDVDGDLLVGTGSDIVILVISAIVIWLGLRIIPQAVAGVTPGKKVTGIRVVRPDGQPLGFGTSLVRELLLLVDSLFFYLVGLITALASKNNQRVGDHVANTFVVRSYAAGEPQSALPSVQPTSALSPPAAPVEATPTWDPVRNAYVFHEPTTGEVQIYDERTGKWRRAD